MAKHKDLSLAARLGIKCACNGSVREAEAGASLRLANQLARSRWHIPRQEETDSVSEGQGG